jgi:DNA-binding beta-propeller fold protein YncE
LLGHVELPANKSNGGFDHADIHSPTDRLYVAHTSNDAVDVNDIASYKYIESVPGLTGVAGALVSEARGLVFTSNRGENTVSVFAPGTERDAIKIRVGVKPNGLAFDAARGILIAANIGDAAVQDSHTVSVVDVARRERIAEVEVPGRTRWTIFDAARETFFVNISSPALIIAIDAREPAKVAKAYEIPAEGPHGLDFDPESGRLLCACDAGVLLAIDVTSGAVVGKVALSGTPDVIFCTRNPSAFTWPSGTPGS